MKQRGRPKKEEHEKDAIKDDKKQIKDLKKLCNVVEIIKFNFTKGELLENEIKF